MFMPQLPQDPKCPQAGYTYGGARCTCECHRTPGIMHVMACCHIGTAKDMKEQYEADIKFLTEDEEPNT